jgi:hypothetical protein
MLNPVLKISDGAIRLTLVFRKEPNCLQVTTETDPIYCEMAPLESVQIRSPLFWDTTLH